MVMLHIIVDPGLMFRVQCIISRLLGHPVRLVGPSRCSGRIEVFYNGAWGTVSDNGWDLNDAQVVCRQLGCGLAIAAPHSAYFGKGTDKIWVDNVMCTGSETYLTQCSLSGFQSHNLSHSQVASVICSAGQIRLVGPNRCSGRVEIYYNRSWVAVCNGSKDLNVARTICRQLGCGTALGLHHFGEGAGQTWVDDLACTGNERHISECLKPGSVRQDCAHSEDVGVICSGLIKPTITINPQSDITLGQNISVTCLVPNVQLGGTFIFKWTSDASSLTVESNSSSATFYIPQIGFEHEGSYQCQFRIRVSNEDFITDFSNSVQLNLNAILPKPSITIEPAGVITFGELVTITCSISTQLLNGSFILQRRPNYSNFYDMKSQSSSINSSIFRFLEVTSDHEGYYRCYYTKAVIIRTLTSPVSDSLPLFITDT
ncbi:deleted in malignant brain tumors 1 protein-like [Cyprinodon tularosa]|uniref:deleted in malignant brain tumors 1 protein-like n=1 Tax=Cyprinodon tularosa TaxID=77115 RepID=UPI0018E1F405|nr:deleted in malignant brain tumors 1 protein-like [Cyprinodon tularosa]